MILLRLAFLRSRLEFEQFFPPGLGMPAFAKGFEAYHLGMSRMHPEVARPFLSDHSVVADVLVREEPDEEEEDEDDGKENDDEEENDGGEQDDDEDEGYSE